MRKFHELVQSAKKILADPIATLPELVDVIRHMEEIEAEARLMRIRDSRRLGQFLKEADAAGWGDAARELLEHPESDEFERLCDARIAELDAS